VEGAGRGGGHGGGFGSMLVAGGGRFEVSHLLIHEFKWKIKAFGSGKGGGGSRKGEGQGWRDSLLEKRIDKGELKNTMKSRLMGGKAARDLVWN